MNKQYRFTNYPDLNRGGNMANDSYNEYMLSADGGADLKSLQANVDGLTSQISELQKRRDDFQATVTALQVELEKRVPFFQSCVKHKSSQTNKKWWCGEPGNPDKRAETWHSEEKKLLDEYASTVTNYKVEILTMDAKLKALNVDLGKAVSQLNASRESTSMAAMTPEQRAAYEATKAKAKAEGEALKKASEIQAQAQAQATIVKAQQRKIIVVGGVVALVAGVVLYFVFKKKPAIK